MTERFYSIDSMLIIGILIICIVILQELAFRYGIKNASKQGGASSQAQSLQSSLLTLFSLLLGFTFSLAASRYDERKLILLGEANAIGTAYLRADIMPQASEKKLRHMLRDYLDSRIETYRSPRESPFQRAALEKADRLEREFWTVAVEEAKKNPTSLSSLVLSSLNEVMDWREKQFAAFSNFIPSSILFFLLLFSTAAMGGIGFLNGLVGQRYLILSFLLSVLVAMTLFMVLDLDRPQRGFIRLGYENLLHLRENLEEYERGG